MADLSEQFNAASDCYIRERDVNNALENLKDGQLCRALHILEDACQQKRFYPLMSAVYQEQLSQALTRTLRVHTGTSRQKEIVNQLRAAGLVVATGKTHFAVLHGLAKTNPIYEWQWQALVQEGSFVPQLTNEQIARLTRLVRNTPEHFIWGWTNILIWTSSREDVPLASTGGLRILCNPLSKVEGTPGTSLSLYDVTVHPFVKEMMIGGSRKIARVIHAPELIHRRMMTINANDQIERGYSRLH
ncbi:MAG TPA: hypothetical protein VF281_00975 [Candidatus Saccharimonadales bacterium]